MALRLQKRERGERDPGAPGHGDKALIEEPVFARLGKKYGKTSAQVILRWHTQMGFAVIPGSKSVEHIRDNLDILDFTLTGDEMAEIARLNKGVRYYNRTDEQLAGFAGWRPQFETKRRGDTTLNKPYVICYMMTSVDGRIDCAMTEQLPGVEEYYPILRQMDFDAAVSGRVTAELEMAEPGKFTPRDPSPVGKEAVLNQAGPPSTPRFWTPACWTRSSS